MISWQKGSQTMLVVIRNPATVRGCFTMAQIDTRNLQGPRFKTWSRRGQATISGVASPTWEWMNLCRCWVTVEASVAGPEVVYPQRHGGLPSQPRDGGLGTGLHDQTRWWIIEVRSLPIKCLASTC